MKNLILFFFLLILKVFLNLALDVIYKCNRFFKILLKKNLKLILGKKNSFFLFFLYFMLLLLKVNFITKKKVVKKKFITYGFKIIFALYKNNNILYTSFYQDF